MPPSPRTHSRLQRSSLTHRKLKNLTSTTRALTLVETAAGIIQFRQTLPYVKRLAPTPSLVGHKPRSMVIPPPFPYPRSGTNSFDFTFRLGKLSTEKINCLGNHNPLPQPGPSDQIERLRSG